MPGFANNTRIGVQPLTSFYSVDTTEQMPSGAIVAGDDSWWGGGGEFMYVKAGGTITQFALVTILPTFSSALNRWEFVATEVPNTANLGRSVGVAMIAATSGQFIWAQIAGVTPVKAGASVAADTSFGITAAGTTGAVAAGKQILNARVVGAATTTVAKSNCVSPSGSTVLSVPNADGWFPGIYLSGTGIAAATLISSVDISGKKVVLNNATTAAVNGTVTGTYNNATIFYNVAVLNRPFAQGAIT